MSAGAARDLLGRLCAGPDDARPGPAVLIVTAHPDDEVIGAGSRLRRLPHPSFVHVTDGSPRDLGDARAAGFATRQGYALVRRREFQAMLAEAGVVPGQVRMLGFVDQEASLFLGPLTLALAVVLSQVQPEAVLTHPYEGGHADHDAAAFGVHAACRWLEARGVRPPPVIEMASYHAGPPGMVAGEFLPGGEGEVISHVLSEEEQAFKRRLMTCYVSQRRVLRWFPLAAERYRRAPRYDFTAPPHEGRLFYENFIRGITPERWRVLAAQALRDLGL